ncbi:MAG: hypothetical protein ABSG26_02850 [Bryobacteraceae bacterium]|jgi:hypothetical protein
MALVGIARLASRSELLETKRGVQYFEMPARSILNRTKPHMPFQWTINPKFLKDSGGILLIRREIAQNSVSNYWQQGE